MNIPWGLLQKGVTYLWRRGSSLFRIDIEQRKLKKHYSALEVRWKQTFVDRISEFMDLLISSRGDTISNYLIALSGGQYTRTLSFHREVRHLETLESMARMLEDELKRPASSSFYFSVQLLGFLIREYEGIAHSIHGAMAGMMQDPSIPATAKTGIAQGWDRIGLKHNHFIQRWADFCHDYNSSAPPQDLNPHYRPLARI